MAMRRWPRDQKSKPEVNSRDVSKWTIERLKHMCVDLSDYNIIFETNFQQNTNTTLSTRRNAQIHIN